MRILLTSCRMPAAIDEIRKLGRHGHFIVAADTFEGAPGNHSKYVHRTEIVASPRYKPEAFVDDIARIITEQKIDLVVPCFEEALFLAHALDRLPTTAQYLFPSFDALYALHHKVRVVEIAAELGVRAPRSIEVTNAADLAHAKKAFRHYFAKPVYSRGGVHADTNRGPLATARDPSTCEPTREAPWVVEEYIDGLDVCSFSVAHRGRVAGHVSYVHPREIEHAGGTVFESVDDPEALEIVRRFVAWSGYEGQLGFDFRKTPDGLSVIECNTRPTAGVHLFGEDTFVDALLSESAADTAVVPAGVRAKYSFALLRNMVLHVEEALDDLRHLFSRSREAIAIADDPWPAAYQIASLSVVRAYRRRRAEQKARATDLMAAYFDDISWSGEARTAFASESQSTFA